MSRYKTGPATWRDDEPGRPEPLSRRQDAAVEPGEFVTPVRTDHAAAQRAYRARQRARVAS